MSIWKRMLSVLRRRNRVYDDVYDAYVAGVKAQHYNAGHSDGCQDGYAYGYDLFSYAFFNATKHMFCVHPDTRFCIDECPNDIICGCDHEKHNTYLKTEYERGLIDGINGVYHFSGDGLAHPLPAQRPVYGVTDSMRFGTDEPTQYPVDPLAPPTRQDSADDAIATITDLMRHGG